MEKSKSRHISCEIETGTCGSGEEGQIEEVQLNLQERVQLIYYTDPICSACWAIEPYLKKFELEYGEYLRIEHKMGGLLPGWKGFADRANGISRPSDVAHHWDEVGQLTGMSIDGDIWVEDPLESSFPPSIAFKAAQRQGEAFAVCFLRRIREQLFLEKKNITKEAVLLEAINDCQGDSGQFLKDYHDPATEQSFHVEKRMRKTYGVRGFPTFIFIGKDGKGYRISGTSGYENYVLALEKAYGKTLTPAPIRVSELALVQTYGLLATKEISTVLSQDAAITYSNLKQLAEEGAVLHVPHKFGDFWKKVAVIA
ncbi:MAG: DsbA family protein [Bacteroidota bacterium]